MSEYDPALDLSADDVAHLRVNVMGKTQAELADLLQVARRTVIKWESGDEPIKRVNSLAIRHLATIYRKAEPKKRQPVKAEPFRYG